MQAGSIGINSTILPSTTKSRKVSPGLFHLLAQTLNVHISVIYHLSFYSLQVSAWLHGSQGGRHHLYHNFPLHDVLCRFCTPGHRRIDTAEPLYLMHQLTFYFLIHVLLLISVQQQVRKCVKLVIFNIAGQCGALASAGCQVPIKAALSLPLCYRIGGENKIKGFWVFKWVYISHFTQWKTEPL